MSLLANYFTRGRSGNLITINTSKIIAIFPEGKHYLNIIFSFRDFVNWIKSI